MEVIIEQVILLAVIVISLSCHECCHGLAAYRLGDHTAKDMGRLTLNPIKPVSYTHLDVYKRQIVWTA